MMLGLQTALLLIGTISWGGTQNLEREFKLAYRYFASGEQKAAREMVEEAIKRTDMPDSLNAGWWALYGYVLSKQPGSADLAIDAFEKSLEIYRKIGSVDGEAYAMKGLARQYLNAQRLEEARALIKTLTPVGGEADHYLLFLMARLNFLEGRYDVGLQDAQQCLVMAKKDGQLSAIAQAQILVGFFQMLNGDMEGGYKSTLDGQAGVVEAGDDNDYFYSLVNLVMYQRCKNGSPSEQSVRLINARLKREYESDLSYVLKFALEEFQCPSL